MACTKVNPPYYCPAVEVVPSQFTDPAIVERTFAILEEIQQVPVLVKKEVPGFVLNRLQYALLGEAMRLVKAGVCSVEGIDKIMSEGLGMRYAFLGPIGVAHLNAPNGFADYSQRYGESIVGVQKDFGPVPQFTHELVENIVTQEEKVIPGEKFLDAIEWRNDCLSKLAKIKRENKMP